MNDKRFEVTWLKHKTIKIDGVELGHNTLTFNPPTLDHEKE